MVQVANWGLSLRPPVMPRARGRTRVASRGNPPHPRVERAMSHPVAASGPLLEDDS